MVSSLWATPLLAQGDGGGPVPVAEGTPGSFAVGYSYLNMNLGGQPTANLSGIGTSTMIDFFPRWSAGLDASFVRAGRDPGSGHSSYVLSVLAGPVFIAKQNYRTNTRLLVRALGGVSLVDSSVQVNQLYYRGWLSRFSWAVGTGIERQVAPSAFRLPPFVFRIDFDYLRTRFMGSSAVVQPQNGIRLSASFVFRFGARETAARTTRKP